MRVTTSCSGRFWIFDQARELHRHGVLHMFINDYPKWMTRRWSIPDKKVTSLLANGVMNRTTRWIPESWTALKSSAVKEAHDLFSRRLPGCLPPDSDVFIGLSSFCLQAIERAKEYGQLAVVDHGSLHQRIERKLLEEESRLHGLPADTDLAPEWIIEKEDVEFHAADGVMVLSQAAKRSLIEAGVEGKKIFVNACGVDLSQFFPPDRKDDTVFRIIYCGSLSPRKGVHYLMQAFAELGLGGAELWLIGSAPGPAFERLIAKYRSNKVRFLGTFPQGKLRQLYSHGSVFVLPSLADGFGMVVAQALACGLPAIVTENVGAADVIREGENGFVVPIRDVETLKERLERLYRDRRLRRDMADAAARDAGEHLSWEAYGERLVAFLDGVVVKNSGLAAQQGSDA